MKDSKHPQNASGFVSIANQPPSEGQSTNESISIRAVVDRCQSGDFLGVLELLRQLWPDKTLNGDSLHVVYDRALASENQVYLCVRAAGAVIGFGSLTIKNNLWQEGNLGHIDELVVHEAHRGQGVGTRLLEALVACARQKGCRRVELDSAPHRREAHQFYEKHGFENRAFLFSKIL